MNVFSVLDQANHHKRDGLMNEAAHARFMSYGLAVLRTSGGRKWCDESQGLINDDLIEYFEKQLSDEGQVKRLLSTSCQNSGFDKIF